MKNPRWKSGGVLNVFCGWCLSTYGKSVLKYKYHGDTKEFLKTRQSSCTYHGAPENKISFENIRKPRKR